MQNENDYDEKPGPYKEKADDFKNLSTNELYEKYPSDTEIHNAISAKNSVANFASSKFTDKKTALHFVERAVNKIADNIEHGRIEEYRSREYNDEQER